MEQTRELYSSSETHTAVSLRQYIYRIIDKLLIVGIAIWAAFIVSAGAIPAGEARLRVLALTSAGQGFDLVRWEMDAVSSKLLAVVTQPGAQLDEATATQLVRDYMARAVRVGHLEREAEQLESLLIPTRDEQARLAELNDELADLRSLQASVRPTVEDVLERQITWALAESGVAMGGFVFPPVKFAFTEPPRVVIVSSRDRIETKYSRMVRPGLMIEEIEEIEARINRQPNAAGYVTNIGGLGAYPAMVVDRANLRWVLSTIAHEWAHNYLTFFPLGLFYFGSGDLRTMNETVADIVGEEIGMAVLRRYYPDLVPPDPEPELEVVLEPEAIGEDEPSDDEPLEDREAVVYLDDVEGEIEAPEVEEFVFDFRAEMRETRLEVDRLLQEGLVEEAEAYMKLRRLFFVENGRAIRVLNQAYFAFHGSYATGPASISPIGPKMEALRAATPDLPAFLEAVRWFTTQEDLDNALAEWAGEELR